MLHQKGLVPAVLRILYWIFKLPHHRSPFRCLTLSALSAGVISRSVTISTPPVGELHRGKSCPRRPRGIPHRKTPCPRTSTVGQPLHRVCSSSHWYTTMTICPWLKEFRRHGAAHVMLMELEKERRKRNCRALIVEVGRDNTAGLNTYKKLGMRLIDDGRILYRKRLL